MTARSATKLLSILIWAPTASAQSAPEEPEFMTPTRPTFSESSKIQRTGVLQAGYGVDADFRSDEFTSQQGAPLAVQFAVHSRLRLDLDWDTVALQTVQRQMMMRHRDSGRGDLRLGFKTVAVDKPEKRLAVAFSYSLKLPTASSTKRLGTGRVDHHVRLILDRTLGKFELALNPFYLNVGREDSAKRASGAGAVFNVQRKLRARFTATSEIYGMSVTEAQPRGIFAASAVIYQVNERLSFDAGVRFGLNPSAPRVGLFGGLSIGVADIYNRTRR